jgi:hypothetical protein
MRHPVPLLPVTFAVRYNKIVSEINGIFGARDEMINLSPFSLHRATQYKHLPCCKSNSTAPAAPRAPCSEPNRNRGDPRSVSPSRFSFILRTSCSHAERMACWIRDFMRRSAGGQGPDSASGRHHLLKNRPPCVGCSYSGEAISDHISRSNCWRSLGFPRNFASGSNGISNEQSASTSTGLNTSKKLSSAE